MNSITINIRVYICLFLLCNNLEWILGEEKVRTKKSLSFPRASLWGLFMAIAVPIDIPDQNVFVSYNYEANYHVPINSTEMGDMMLLAPISTVTTSRAFSRRHTYNILEDNFNKSGYPGRKCVLRSICEAAETPLNHNGVLGGIMHVLFTPSSSQNESLSPAYYLAEKHGSMGDCGEYVSGCPAGLLDSISRVIHLPTL